MTPSLPRTFAPAVAALTAQLARALTDWDAQIASRLATSRSPAAGRRASDAELASLAADVEAQLADLHTQHATADRDAADWEARAIQAVAEGRHDLARTALVQHRAHAESAAVLGIELRSVTVLHETARALLAHRSGGSEGP